MTLLTMFLRILTMLFSLTSAQDITSTSLADQRCPCRFSSECGMRFAETNPLANNAVQQFIPSCPALQGRCCTPETMLATIIELVQQQQQHFVQPQSIQSELEQRQFVQPQPRTQPYSEQPRFELFRTVQSQSVQPQFVHVQSQFDPPQPRSPPSQSGLRGSRFLSCVSVNQCPAGNIYGTDPSHFQEFEFISQEESQCLSREGEVLCIIQEPAVEPSQELPCVQPSSCSEVYGEVSHIAEFGLQFSCDISTQVRCVTVTNTSPSNPSPPPPPLPCVQSGLCSEVYGTQATHFTLYGVQNTCPASDQVRCVVVITQTTPSTFHHSTTTRGYSTTTRGYSSIHPLFTSQAPVTPPTAAVVNIIGPSPLYLGFGNNHGPSVHHSLETVNDQAGGDKQQQIRALLELLDKRLKQIVQRLPNQGSVY